MRDLRRALIAVWLILATACGCAVAVPFIASGPFPVCEARARNSSCAACGVTTGFIAISRGRWTEAQDANRAAIPLFAGFAGNFAAALAYTIWKLRFGGTKCNL